MLEPTRVEEGPEVDGFLDEAAVHNSGVLVIARLLPIVFAGLMPGFLLGLSLRTGGKVDLTLVMPRRDIASYLRLATETVSRLFARFQKKELIKVRRKRVELLDIQGLEAIGGNCDIAVYGGYRQPLGR